MNYTTAIFLINDKARAVLGAYEADTPTVKAPRTLFKTLDQKLKVGDLALVPSSSQERLLPDWHAPIRVVSAKGLNNEDNWAAVVKIYGEGCRPRVLRI